MPTTTATPIIADVTVTRDEQGLHVKTFWAVAGITLDRPQTHGFLVPNKVMADRLERAIRAGVVYTGATVATDIYDHTYVAANSLVMGRRMGADLTRLGY